MTSWSSAVNYRPETQTHLEYSIDTYQLKDLDRVHGQETWDLDRVHAIGYIINGQLQVMGC